jgi:hypothetical protein
MLQSITHKLYIKSEQAQSFLGQLVMQHVTYQAAYVTGIYLALRTVKGKAVPLHAMEAHGGEEV